MPRALEAVCLKALSELPERRYSSSRQLARDIENWLADEPISAWREPLLARVRRWARRHHTAMTGSAAALVVAVIGLSAVAVSQSRARTALESALAETTDAKREAERALVQKASALAESEESRKRVQSVLTFLRNDVLAATRPEDQHGGLGREVTVRKAIDAAEPKIAVAFKGQPIVEAEVRDTLGLTYLYLGEAAGDSSTGECGAIGVATDQPGPDQTNTLISRGNLANAYVAAGHITDAIKVHETTLKLFEATLGLGENHPDTLQSRNSLAAPTGPPGAAC